MEWTQDLPKVEGWYWACDRRFSAWENEPSVEMKRVWIVNGDVQAAFIKNAYDSYHTTMSARGMDVYWFGPLEIPSPPEERKSDG